MSRCFIFGCSHSAGMDMVSIDQYLVKDGHVYDQRTYGYHHSYAAIVGRDLGYTDIQNHSIPGGSTDAMVRIFREVVDDMDPSQDLAMACWTGGDRTEYWEPDYGIWVQLNAHKTGFYRIKPSNIALQGLFYGRLIVTERFQQENTQWVLESSLESALQRLETNMLTMNRLSQDRGIRLMNLCSFTTGWFPEVVKKGCWPSYSQVKDYWWPTGTKVSFLEFCKEKKFTPDQWGHYPESAHHAFANLILTAIHGSQ